MKSKLLKLGLSEALVNDLLSVHENYMGTLRIYSKPVGQKAFEKNIGNIEKKAENLCMELKNLTEFERQQLNFLGLIDIRDITMKIGHLKNSCIVLKEKNFSKSFSRKEPFLRSLAIEVKEVLKKHDIPVKIYRDNVFCSILDILLNQKAGEKSFSLLREISKPA